MNPFLSHWCAVAIGLLLAGAAAAPACAATITVTTTADTGPGSFRQAVANAAAGDTINFNLTWPATIGLFTGPLYITRNLTIAGPGADKLTFDGNNSGSDMLQVFEPSALRVSGVTVRNAGFVGIYVPAGSLSLSDCVFVNNKGKAVVVWGDLSVENCVFADNRAQTSSGQDRGAAIYIADGATTISNSTFARNASEEGCGAIHNAGTGPMTVRKSTFTDNTGFGTNSSQGGALCSSGPLTLDASTFTGNYALGYGGAIVAGTGTVTHSTFSENASSLGGDSINGGPGLTVSRSILESCRGTLTSGGDNIVSSGSCFAASTALNDRVSLDPLLHALADNGGPTKTMALQAGSPAIDQVIVNAAGCTGTDQRGAARPSGARCDIGAYERNADLLFDNGFD